MTGSAWTRRYWSAYSTVEFAMALSDLKAAIDRRDIPFAKKVLEGADREIDALQPLRSGAAASLDQLARWIDFDESYLPRVKSLVRRFNVNAGEHRIDESARIAVAAGLVALHEGSFTEADVHFNYAAVVGDRLDDADLMTASRYFLARSHWKRTEYHQALKWNEQALQHAERLGAPSVAVILMLDAWLLFLTRNSADAANRLKEAAATLNRTNDFINHGNIKSFQARLERRSGDYSRSDQLLHDAIVDYSKVDPAHRNVARSLRNLAFVKRLRALAISKRDPAKARALRKDAESDLQNALGIYAKHHDKLARGVGTVHTVRGLLALDAGKNTDAWEAAAEEAYRVGQAANDALVMAHAKVIQAKIRLSGEPGGAQAARELAAEALVHANTTDNRRATARAHLYLGLAFRDDPFCDPIEARREFSEAETLLPDDEHDYLRQEIKDAKASLAGMNPDHTIVVRITRGQLTRPLEAIVDDVKRKVVREVYAMEHKYDETGSQKRTAVKLKIGKQTVRWALKSGQ